MQDICNRLSDLEDAPWREYHKGSSMTTYQLGKLLSDYGAKAHSIHIAPSHKPKGFLREDLEDLWTRYLKPPQEGENSGHPVTSAQPGQETGDQKVTGDLHPVTFSPNGVDRDPAPY